MPRNERHVVPNGNKWQSQNPATGQVSNHNTQGNAERAAKKDIARDGGGEVVIHRPDGRIRDSDTIAPGRDPNPPRDTQH